MKILSALLLSLLVIGCAPSYFWRPYDSLTDEDLCSHLGYSMAMADSNRVRGTMKELAKRESQGTLSISRSECETAVSLGQLDRVDQLRKVQALQQAAENARTD